MPAELVRSTQLFPGVPHAYAASAPETGLIVTAGACPLDGQGQVVAPGDIATQTRQAFDNLIIALGECGAEMWDVLKTTVFVASHSREDLTVAWNEVAAAFGRHDPPSTLLGRGSGLPGSACRDRGDCLRGTALTAAWMGCSTRR
jgi:enamine deaminase RidA (YjgF/YER057c/UK114 family)